MESESETPAERRARAQQALTNLHLEEIAKAARQPSPRPPNAAPPAAGNPHGFWGIVGAIVVALVVFAIIAKFLRF